MVKPLDKVVGDINAKTRKAKQTAGPAPSANGAHADDDKPRLSTTRLDGIKPTPIRWLVPGYIPLGKLVLLAGDGGHGKSALTLGMAADVTRGRPCFGLTYDAGAPAEVLLISCEDDYGDTVVPRLLSAGADLEKVFRVDGIPSKPAPGKPAEILPFNMLYFDAMERELEARPGVRVVVIDPAGAYVGKAGIDDHKDSELRALLGPLSEVAARRRVTIIIVKHLVKGATAKAVHRVGGSTGYINTVRAAYIVCPDADDETKKLFLPIKFNLGPKPPGLSYVLQSLDADERDAVLSPFDHLQDDDREHLGKQLFRVEWTGAVETNADDALNATAKKDGNKVQKAAAWLEKFLASCAFPSDEILAAAKDEGFTFDNVKEAKARLKAEGLRNSNLGRLRGVWWSGFGDPRDWALREESTTPPPLKKEEKEEENTSPFSPLSPLTPRSPHIGGGSNVGRVGSVGSAGTEGEGDEPEYDPADNPFR